MSARVEHPELTALAASMRDARTIVLTGAGCSTESGIPDYRGPETRRRARHPIQIREFLASGAARRRYWARSFVGWPRFRAARPNPAHRALATLETNGHLAGLLTQNVDGLHVEAGSRSLVELHGSLARVRCLGCGAFEARDALQLRLEAANERFRSVVSAFAPDGDADLDEESVATFEPLGCLRCGADLRPDVVFFGENVAREVVAKAWELFDAASFLLVIGSSLEVFSGFRFVREAHRRKMPIALVCLGPTRGDPLVNFKIEARAGLALPVLTRAIEAAWSPTPVSAT